ncbi:hypothetical protein [Mesoplasma photuris]|uniref:hypothetical protein n=1 Tax=Mesoplasma photuris TaxID=217731 RepID=UPI0004E1204E|nr:hypothetical protein [Mesoplasma photuris]
MNKFEYEKDFFDIVDDEVFLIEYYPEFKGEPTAKLIGDKWREIFNYSEYREYISDIFSKIKPVFIGLESDQLPDGVSDMLIIRMNALTTVAYDYQQFYLTLLEEYGSKPLNELGIDALIDRTYFELMNAYVESFQNTLLNMEIVEPFSLFYKDLKNFFEDFQVAKTSEQVNEKIYLIQESLSDFIDSLDETDIDLDPEEIALANVFLKFATYIETIIYYLIVVHETLQDKAEKNAGLVNDELKLYILERDERIQMVETMNSHIVKN